MSIVKMRCWNNYLKAWDKCAYPIFEGLNPVKVIGFQGNDGHEYLIEDGHEVVLFTGLKDKNGIEIFEGDLLKISDREDIQSVYLDSEGCYGTNEFALFELNRSEHRTFEVVGSVYANTELLTK